MLLRGPSYPWDEIFYPLTHLHARCEEPCLETGYFWPWMGEGSLPPPPKPPPTPCLLVSGVRGGKRGSPVTGSQEGCLVLLGGGSGRGGAGRARSCGSGVRREARPPMRTARRLVFSFALGCSKFRELSDASLLSERGFLSQSSPRLQGQCVPSTLVVGPSPTAESSHLQAQSVQAKTPANRQ